MNAPVWNWNAFAGSAQALAYNKRDLPMLDRIVAMARGRSVAVQAGGNLGVWPKRLSELFATVYAFEPAADLFARMMRNAPESNIVKFQAALGCERGLVGMSQVRRDGKSNAHEGITHVSGPGNVPTLMVDDLGLTVCDAIILDIEGYELYALMGAVDTLRRCRPLVAAEVNKSLDYVPISESDIRGFFATQGYQYETTFGQDHVYVPIEWRRQ